MSEKTRSGATANSTWIDRWFGTPSLQAFAGVHPDRLYHDDWNGHRSITFIYIPRSEAKGFFHDSYPADHSALLQRDGGVIGKQLLGDRFVATDLAVKRTFGSSRYDAVRAGAVLGRIGYWGIFRKTRVISIWNADLLEETLKETLRIITQTCPEFSTPRTVVYQEFGRVDWLADILA